MNDAKTLDQRLTPIVEEIINAGVPLHDAMRVIDEKFVSVALVMTHGNVTQASKRLGVHRNTLHGRLRRRLVADIDRVAIAERTRRRR